MLKMLDFINVTRTGISILTRQRYKIQDLRAEFLNESLFIHFLSFFFNSSYVCWSGDLELAGSDEAETPIQKYQRLNCEVRELHEELLAAKDNEESKKEGGNESLGNVALKVSGLQEELTRLRLEEVLGSQVLRDLQDPQVSCQKKKKQPGRATYRPFFENQFLP